MSDIVWPARFLPGTTDNYVSNETIVAGLCAADVWPWLKDTAAWPTYYSNVSDIRFHDGSGPGLRQGARFRFTTFSFSVEAQVTSTRRPPTASPAASPGTAGSRAMRRRAWMCTMPGCSKTCPAAACASSRKRRRSASRPSHWPAPCPTRCSTPTRLGSTAWPVVRLKVRVTVGKPPAEGSGACREVEVWSALHGRLQGAVSGVSHVSNSRARSQRWPGCRCVRACQATTLVKPGIRRADRAASNLPPRNQPSRDHGDQIARAQDLGQDQEAAHRQGHPARPAEPGQRFIRHARETAPTYDTSA